MRLNRRKAILLGMAGALGIGVSGGAFWASPASVDHRTFGINVAGAEFGSDENVPGMLNEDYRYPSDDYIAALSERGYRLFRIPFRWERVQQGLGGPLNKENVDELARVLSACESNGTKVILDLHNYGRYVQDGSEELRLGDGVSVDNFMQFWRIFSAEFDVFDSVLGWGLMNEPHGLSEENANSDSSDSHDEGARIWRNYSQAAVESIRAAGSRRSIFVSGYHWANLSGWNRFNPKPWISDAMDGVIYEAHYYFTPSNSGKFESVQLADRDSVDRGYVDLADRVRREIEDFRVWLSDNKCLGYIGECGWPADGVDAELWASMGKLALDRFAASGIGAAYWATGSLWSERYRLQPYSKTIPLEAGPQARVVEKYL